MTTKKYFEIHVTLNENDNLQVRGWNNSNIDGDPDLGKGSRCYRTAHIKSLEQALKKIQQAKIIWPEAIRYKIEHVIYDVR